MLIAPSHILALHHSPGYYVPMLWLTSEKGHRFFYKHITLTALTLDLVALVYFAMTQGVPFPSVSLMISVCLLGCWE